MLSFTDWRMNFSVIDSNISGSLHFSSSAVVMLSVLLCIGKINQFSFFRRAKNKVGT